MSNSSFIWLSLLGASEIQNIPIRVSELERPRSPRVGGRFIEHFRSQRQEPLIFCVNIIHVKADDYVIRAARFNIAESLIFVCNINVVENKRQPIY